MAPYSSMSVRPRKGGAPNTITHSVTPSAHTSDGGAIGASSEMSSGAVKSGVPSWRSPAPRSSSRAATRRIDDDAKVGDLQTAVRGEQQVGRLDVAVGDADGVQVREAARGVAKVAAGVALREWPHAALERARVGGGGGAEERAARHKLHDDVDGAVGVAQHLVEADDVVVRQLLHHRDLGVRRVGRHLRRAAAVALGRGAKAAADRRRRDVLDGVRPVGERVEAEVDLAKGAVAHRRHHEELVHVAVAVAVARVRDAEGLARFAEGLVGVGGAANQRVDAVEAELGHREATAQRHLGGEALPKRRSAAGGLPLPAGARCFSGERDGEPLF